MTEAYCIRVHETGGPEVLKREPLELTDPGAGQVRVRVHAIGLNFIDTYNRSGLYPMPLPFIPGREMAGVVDAVGEGVNDWKPGDRVGFVGLRAYATHVTAPAGQLIALPDEVSFETAAAMLLKGLTAWMLLFEIRRASPGDTALVWAPVGGVGSLLVPWATSLGVKVIGVTSTEEKAALARKAGAAHVILRGAGDVAGQVRELTGGAGVDVAYDSVGKASADASLASLKPRGWWISFGNASGAVEPIAPGRFGQLGSLNVTRPSLFHFISDAASLARGTAALYGALRTGTISPLIEQTFPLEQAGEAHSLLESGRTTGTTLLLP
jgi:NADPH2:quinone reductase